jgi:hypothetical protein
MPTAKTKHGRSGAALHRQHYGDEFAVIVQDEHLVPRLLALLIERRQSATRAPDDCAGILDHRADALRAGDGAHWRRAQLMFADGSGAFRIDWPWRGAARDPLPAPRQDRP